MTLSGTIGNFYKKWSALDTVMNLPDVVKVIDQIKIKLNDISEDIDIRININKALKNDSRLEQTDVSCNVRRGNVTLTGKVNTHYQRISA